MLFRDLGRNKKGKSYFLIAFKVETSNPDRTISLRLQCVVKEHNYRVHV
jgi:hypothetical protein